MKFSCAPALAALCLFAACSAKPPATLIEENKAAEAKAVELEKAAQAEADKKKYELTPEEEQLMAADPKSLTPEQRRKRAYAFRKKTMQNPDSAAARTLEDARKAALAGQLEFEAKPANPADNGVVIPAPDYLRSDKPMGADADSDKASE